MPLLRWLITRDDGRRQPDIPSSSTLARAQLDAADCRIRRRWTTAAFAEELLFHGFIMHSVHRFMSEATPRARRDSGSSSRRCCSGSVAAYQGSAGAIVTFAIALGYGAAFFANRRNLWSAIARHGLYDTVAFLIVFLNWDQVLHAST